ncbi:hypothetical protein O1611_g7245 [Lasiodiplodia mahajangana]|uniref:Uncharacterized protein n=1 Tax=Lasiodiplodia mahajangana TaxID=1108764 RepID=A0ACC2JG48_9PEZI|nr:hypothetical protein O1611_g7245 [Lasiodiplodia mahajangana]
MDLPQEASLNHHQSSLGDTISLSNLTGVSSLVGVIDIPEGLPLRTDQRSIATNKFHRIVDYFKIHDTDRGPYNRPRLVNLTHEYSLTEESRDNLLRAFFKAVALSVNHDEDIDFDELRPKFFSFADFLLDNFFLPLKASAKRTPQPSPDYHSAVQEGQAAIAQGFVGTPARVATLRGECLIRDHHRCVISRSFDTREARNRFKREISTQPAKDDEGRPLLQEQRYANLEVAHILPHSLMKVNSNSQLDNSREAALRILNMFDQGVVNLIEGADIDRPSNALTLTKDLHEQFGDFQIFFEPIEDAQQPHTYRVDTFEPPPIALSMGLPVTRTFYLSETRTIDPPSPRLLAIHRAIGHILHLSSAGDYINRLLQDMDEKAIPADGSVDVGRMVQLSLSGWLDGSPTNN